MEKKSFPIGIFDSGVGGLSVLRAIVDIMPQESVVYVADQAHVPYGPRSLEEVKGFSLGITEFLLKQQVKLIVVACNTASAAALRYLRSLFPYVPFVGMEPAVKPATEQTRSGVVGVLATEATFQGELYASVLERFAHGVKVLQHTCPGLVDLIEKGLIYDDRTRRILEDVLFPMLKQGIDTIVLGCTHYPFVIPVIKSIVGEGIKVIDPAPAVARQVRRVLELCGLYKEDPSQGLVTYYTTGEITAFEGVIQSLIGTSVKAYPLFWQDGRLTERLRIGP
ncbi:MAG: glutamate racemase [Syntrophobacterales bacterium]|nr:glutamate racemase [Syntrophobacterales bacterium]